MLKLENILDPSRKGGFFVPKGTVITGTFTADIPGKIAGMINGDVFVKGKVTILKEAVIRGDIYATDVTVYGKISGDIKCTGTTRLEPGARIRGDISTSEIHVEKDTVVEGIITKPVTEKTSVDESVEPDTGEDFTREPPEPKQSLTDENANSQSWF